MHEPGASYGAMAAECAADQDAFWPYQDQLFATSTSRGANGYTISNLIKIAEDMALDVDTFRRCLTQFEHQAAVQKSVDNALSLGLPGTPSVIIDGKVLADPSDFNLISSAVDALLP